MVPTTQNDENKSRTLFNFNSFQGWLYVPQSRAAELMINWKIFLKPSN